jgi:hypothetical protein
MSKLAASMRRVLNQVAFNPDVLAGELTYNVIDGVSSDIAYMPGETSQREVSEADGLYRLRERSVFIPSAAGVGIAVPNVLDTVTIDAEEWAIVSYDSDNVATHKLQIERRELIKKLRR